VSVPLLAVERSLDAPVGRQPHQRDTDIDRLRDPGLRTRESTDIDGSTTT